MDRKEGGVMEPKDYTDYTKDLTGTHHGPHKGHIIRGIRYRAAIIMRELDGSRAMISANGVRPVAVMWCGYELPLHDHSDALDWPTILFEAMDPLVGCSVCKENRAGLPVAVDALNEAKPPEPSSRACSCPPGQTGMVSTCPAHTGANAIKELVKVAKAIPVCQHGMIDPSRLVCADCGRDYQSIRADWLMRRPPFTGNQPEPRTGEVYGAARAFIESRNIERATMAGTPCAVGVHDLDPDRGMCLRCGTIPVPGPAVGPDDFGGSDF